jgi:hypothetical protein
MVEVQHRMLLEPLRTLRSVRHVWLSS